MVLHLKSWLSIPDQINQLRIRGMEIPASDQASDALKIIGYYRLSGYWYLYREPHPTQKDQRLDDFLPGTQFAEILALYHFDSALKGLIWRGIESVEIAFRSRIGHLLGEAGPSLTLTQVTSVEHLTMTSGGGSPKAVSIGPEGTMRQLTTTTITTAATYRSGFSPTYSISRMYRSSMPG
nr:Abi family protein [Brevibacterium sp. UCMA 11752]